LSTTNESATIPILQIFLEVNKASIVYCILILKQGLAFFSFVYGRKTMWIEAMADQEELIFYNLSSLTSNSLREKV